MSQMQVIGMASSSISVPSPAASLGQMRGSLTMPANHAGGAAVAFRPGAQPGVRNWSPGISARPTRPAASPVNSLAATPARPPAPAYAFANGHASNTVCSATRRGREPPMEHVLNEGGSLTIGHHRSPLASPSPSPQAAWAQSGTCITQGIRSTGNSSTDSTLRPVPASRSINSSNEGVLSDRSPPLPGPALLPSRSGATATLQAEERAAAAGGDAGQTRLTTSVSSLASSASVPTLTSERVTSRVQPPVHQLHSLHQSSQFTRDTLSSGANVLSSGGHSSSEEARFAELQRQLLQAREESAASHRLAEERAQEVGTLLARVEMLLARISERDAEVLRLRAAKYQDEMQGRHIAASLRPATTTAGAELNDPKEVAARRLQRAIRPWLAALHRRRDDSSALARDRWKQMLEEVEASVSRALEHAIGKEDVGRVPRQTRLQLLGNTLKHGVLRVNQVMMQQTLQDMRKTGPSKDTSPSPSPSR